MDYEITSPTGKKYRVTAPEGATQDQVMSYAQSQFGHLEAPQTDRNATDVPRETKNGVIASTDPKVVLSNYGQTAKPAPGHTYESAGLKYQNPTLSDYADMAKQGGMDLLRTIGRTGRNIAQGAPSILGMATDAPAHVYEGLTGNQAPAMTKPYQSYTQALESPQLADQTPTERVSSDIQRALAGTAGSMGMAGPLAAPAAGQAPTAQNLIAQSMQANPGMQMASSATGAGASGVTREMGGGQGAQLAAGLIGGMAPPLLQSGGNLLAQTVKNVIKPITKSGQEEIAANILQDQAIDPMKAAANLRAAQDIVPGSQQTTGPASQDLGLLSVQKGMQSKNPAAFGERMSEQNTARQQALASVAGTPEGIKAMQTARDAQTGPMREGAFANALPTDSTPVTAKIDEIMASPAGKRETVSKTMEWAKNLIGNETDPASLYEIRKDLQLAQRGKLQPSSPNAPAASVLALAKGQLGDVINSLDATIENAAPGFKAYLDRYKQLSIPIDQAKILQEIQRRSQLQTMDPTTQQQFLGPANFGRAVDAAIIKNPGKLSPEQLNQLNAIRTDLQMGQAINSPLVKAPGSDTFQNLSIAQAIGGGPTAQHPMMKILSQPLQWIYKAGGSDPAVNEILTNAMLDPKLAATLLTKATPKTVQTFSESLKMKALAGALGTAAQLAATQSKWQGSTDSQQDRQAVAR